METVGDCLQAIVRAMNSVDCLRVINLKLASLKKMVAARSHVFATLRRRKPSGHPLNDVPQSRDQRP